jgi:predicted metalloprotease with PDZ domain
LPTTSAAPTPEPGEGYTRFLGLCSHEYFHTWNVKRIKPAAFAPYDLQAETYTPLLWLFEGFTSYYDDLMLVRSRRIGEKAYLNLLGKAVASVLRGAGRLKQSVADSSFDAWSKYYRQDENAPNAIVSYYAKGSLIALAFDLTIRARTGGKKSLDDVMRALWERFGRNFYPNGQRGVTEAEVEALFDEVSGLRLRSMFERYVRGTEDLPLAKLYAPFGVKLVDERKDAKPSLDANTSRDGADCKLTQVHEGGAAHKAGLSAGDVMVAFGGLRIGGNLEAMLGRYKVGDTVEVHAFRRDELLRFDVTLMGERAPHITLTLPEKGAKKLPRP